MVAFVPSLPPGTRAPLVVVEHGFQLATSDYATLCERVASHGFVVIGVDTGGSAFDPPTNVEERYATIAAIDYAIGEAPCCNGPPQRRAGINARARRARRCAR